jgi:CRISPR-associated protein Cas8b1/Cst1 subtype I-B
VKFFGIKIPYKIADIDNLRIIEFSFDESNKLIEAPKFIIKDYEETIPKVKNPNAEKITNTQALIKFLKQNKDKYTPEELTKLIKIKRKGNFNEIMPNTHSNAALCNSLGGTVSGTACNN